MPDDFPSAEEIVRKLEEMPRNVLAHLVDIEDSDVKMIFHLDGLQWATNEDGEEIDGVAFIPCNQGVVSQGFAITIELPIQHDPSGDIITDAVIIVGKNTPGGFTCLESIGVRLDNGVVPKSRAANAGEVTSSLIIGDPKPLLPEAVEQLSEHPEQRVYLFPRKMTIRNSQSKSGTEIPEIEELTMESGDDYEIGDESPVEELIDEVLQRSIMLFNGKRVVKLFICAYPEITNEEE